MVGLIRASLVIAMLVAVAVGIAIFYYPVVEVDHSGNAALPPTLRIGVLPDEAPERLQQRYEPLMAYFSKHLQSNCELVIPASYAELLSLFEERAVDLAYFGGFTYVKARQQAGAVPLAMRLIDTRFTSYFLVAGDNRAESLQDLHGAKISFGSHLSTSGHLMPRFFLEQQGIVPEAYFGAVEYSGAHDRTAYLVRDGGADVGAANSATVRSMLEDGRLESDDVRVLWETPPYADYVWALQPGFDAAEREKLRDAFLQLTPEIDEHVAILAGLEAKGFIPADPDYFNDLATIANEIEPVIARDQAQ